VRKFTRMQQNRIVTDALNRMRTYLIVLLLSVTPLVAVAATTANIAILTDGRSAQTGKMVQLVKTELQSITGGEFNLRYPQNLQRDGGWSTAQIQRALDQLLAGGEADVIITMGAIGSGLTAKLDPSVPVVAPFVIDSKLQGFPVTEYGTTGVPNLHYLSSNKDIVADVGRFQAATGARHLVVIADQRVLAAVPAARQNIKNLAQKLDIQVDSVPANDNAAEIMAAVDEEADAVFILPLLRLPSSELQMLIEGLNVRRLPTYSAMGRSTVEQGVLMGTALLPRPERLARQLGVDVRDILLGRSAGELPIAFDFGGRLTLNMRTARAIGYSVPFELLYEADLIHEEEESGRLLSLDAVVREALERNLQYAVAQEEYLSAGQTTRVARSSLLPQLGVGLTGQALDRDLAGQGAIRSTSAGISLSQIIYSDSAWASFNVAQHLEAAQSSQLDGVRLDVIQQAAQAYLNVLVMKTQLSIQRENLKVTRANLKRAEFRFRVGAADRSEVYRFETQLGGNRQDVSNARAAYLQTSNQLNQILHRPIEEPFQTSEPGLTDPRIFGDARLSGFISDPRKARIFRNFLVQESLQNSPELMSINEQIAAQKRTLLATKRARYIPDIALTGDIDRIIDDHGALVPALTDGGWKVGVQATLPLYQGSRLDADKQQARIELKRLELLQRQFTDQIETTARASVLQTAASRTNIGFAKDAAGSAAKTLSMVTAAYTRGTRSDVDLVAAQNAALVAQLTSANANYQFLIDLMDVERAIGFFDFFVEPAEKEAWFQRLDAFASTQLQGTTP